MTAVRTLVVDDDPVLADAHATFVGRVTGYTCVGVAPDGPTALRLLAEVPVDLVLLDVGLPGMDGLDVLRAVRARGLPVDVIMVTGVRDLEVVRSAVSGGAVQYLLKPFTFAAFRDKLENYAQYRAALTPEGPPEQGDIDRALAALRSTGGAALPKGLSEDTLALVVAALRGAAGPLSATDAAAATGVSRVTARRYLEHLADTGRAVRSLRYGGGRPENAYRPP
ncbi:MAG TPA: response regulator [Mycobacteriales bacterium]|nr:response regulator [Mycobacteriales bacterium]